MQQNYCVILKVLCHSERSEESIIFIFRNPTALGSTKLFLIMTCENLSRKKTHECIILYFSKKTVIVKKKMLLYLGYFKNGGIRHVGRKTHT